MKSGRQVIWEYEQLILRIPESFNEEFIGDLNAIMGLDVFTEAMFIFFEENNTFPVDTRLELVYNEICRQLESDIRDIPR